MQSTIYSFKASGFVLGFFSGSTARGATNPITGNGLIAPMLLIAPILLTLGKGGLSTPKLGMEELRLGVLTLGACKGLGIVVGG